MNGTAADSSAWRVAVVGGGISGLAAALRVGTACHSTGAALALDLLEAGDRLGGPVHTERIGEFLVETGPDMFVTDKPWAVELVEELGLGDELISTDPTHRRSLVLHRGRPQPVPPGFTLMSTSRVWPVVVSPVLSPWGKLRLAWERFVPARPVDDESLASFGRRRLGNEAFERLVQPLVGGIYTADPEKLSLRATLPRFLDMERRHGSLTRATAVQAAKSKQENAAESGARYGLFVSLRNGLGTLVDALESRVGEFADVRRSTSVAGVHAEDDGTYRLDFGVGTSRPYDAVVLAVPTHVASSLVANLDASLAEELGAIEYASSAVVCSGYPLSQSEHSLEAFGLVVPRVERRNVLAVSVASRKFPGRAPDGHALLRTFVGGALQPELLERSDDELLALVREELAGIFGVRGEPTFERVVRYPRAMPQYHVGHLDRVDRIEERVARHRGLALAGSGYRGVGLPDCVRSGQLAAERLLQSVPAPA